MTEIFINKAKTVAVTGHRVLLEDFDEIKLKKVFLELLLDGYDTFLIGMALGFDTVCFKVLEKLKKDNKINIIACIPCSTQSSKFSIKQKREYDRMLSTADGKVLISEDYTPTCMQKRNVFMVDNASVLVSYLRRDFGGTKNTVNYAKKVNCKIINV